MAEEKKDGKSNETFLAVVQAVANVVTTTIETFGWSGAMLILGFCFVVWYATDEQKQRIINLYVLGEGVSQQWVIIVLSITFVLTAFAQNRWYKKKLKQLTDEIEREGVEKGKLQEKKVTKKLQHAESRTQIGGK